MTRLEFWDEKERQVVANVQAGEPGFIPIIGDHVYIPHGEDSGVYAHVKVTGRQYYFSQQGELAMIRLSCEGLDGERTVSPPA